MSHKDNCWANSVSGSFFHTLKTEPVHHQTCQTRAEARQAIFEYIGGFYSRERLNPANDYRSPVDYELLHKAA
jgi:putative transposase